MRLVVADDSALFREGMVGLLMRQGHEIAAEAASADELVEAPRGPPRTWSSRTCGCRPECPTTA